MGGDIVRLSSRNHKMSYDINKNKATMKLDNLGTNAFDKDFVVYIKDNKFNEPSCISSINEHNEQCLVVSMNPDLRNPKARKQIIDYFKSKGLDHT